MPDHPRFYTVCNCQHHYCPYRNRHRKAKPVNVTPRKKTWLTITSLVWIAAALDVFDVYDSPAWVYLTLLVAYAVTIFAPTPSFLRPKGK